MYLWQDSNLQISRLHHSTTRKNRNQFPNYTWYKYWLAHLGELRVTDTTFSQHPPQCNHAPPPVTPRYM
jgi:hypothetical protein